jgi:hypothetical protein
MANWSVVNASPLVAQLCPPLAVQEASKLAVLVPVEVLVDAEP